MRDYSQMDLSEVRSALRKGELTSVELTENYLERMSEYRELNAYITETGDKSIEMAKSSDEKLFKGEQGRLEGIPIGVKDLFCTKDILTTAGSRILSNFIPTYESTVTSKLWSDGGVLLGKLNLDEFAMGSANLTSFYGGVRNPWRREGEMRYSVPGGSSGGSACAVAARLCVASLGTDTGGSIRQPASFTSTVGVKPTYGRCSRYGIIAYASSLDQAGPITRSVRDAAIMLESICGHDVKDSTSSKKPVPNFEELLELGVKGLRVGYPVDFTTVDLPEDIREMWHEAMDRCRSLGMEVVEVSLPHSRYSLPAYYIIAPAECSSNLARYDGVRYGKRAEDPESLFDLYERTRSEGFGAEVKNRILVGTYVLCSGYYDAYFTKAQKVRSLVGEDFEKAFEMCDVIVTPSTPSSAFLMDEPNESGVNMYLNDVLTVPVNLAGLPGVSVPDRLDSFGMPLGMQVIGRPFEEDVMLRVARALEESASMRTESRKLYIDEE